MPTPSTSRSKWRCSNRTSCHLMRETSSIKTLARYLAHGLSARRIPTSRMPQISSFKLSGKASARPLPHQKTFTTNPPTHLSRGSASEARTKSRERLTYTSCGRMSYARKLMSSIASLTRIMVKTVSWRATLSRSSARISSSWRGTRGWTTCRPRTIWQSRRRKC